MLTGKIVSIRGNQKLFLLVKAYKDHQLFICAGINKICLFFFQTLLSYKAKVESHNDYGPQGPEGERKTPPQEKMTGNLHSFKTGF